MLADELGYEDQEEFEDALKADFKTFIGALPHIEARLHLQKNVARTFPTTFPLALQLAPSPPHLHFVSVA